MERGSISIDNAVAELGVAELVEIGSGKVLANLAKKSPHNFNVTNISNLSELKKYLDS